MFAHVTSLRYWKSERADITTCEDALQFDTRRGIFCVADGAGTTLFSNIWADILVKQFAHDPLTSDDIFEMEWWIRQAQKRYQQQAPTSDKLNWSARQKAAEQGAYATLATMRLTSHDAHSATARLLVIGDSCVLIGRDQRVTSFPLEHAEDFDRAPYCVPALLKKLNRNTLYAKTQEVPLLPGDTVILATDALARWIVSGGGSGQQSLAWDALLEVAKKTESDWPAFIDRCRDKGLIVDDDTTAIIIQMQEMEQGAEQFELSDAPDPALLALRKEEFQHARSIDNKELLAITYGDGRALSAIGLSLTDAEKMQARAVADALRSVLQAMRDAVNTPNFAAKIEPVWWNYADLLMHEPCAENVRRGLEGQGVRLKGPLPPTQPPSPARFANEGGANAQGPHATHPQPLSTLHDRSQPAGRMAGEKVAGHVASPLQQLSGTEHENARVFQTNEPTTVASPAAAIPAPLRAFREALAEGDPFTIAQAYQSSLDSLLSTEEQARLREARATLKSQLVDSLRAALDQENDEAILKAVTFIESSPIKITLMESENQRIKQASDRKKAFERLLDALEEGSATQKVEADAALSQARSRETLTSVQQEQLAIAHHLVDAFQSNDDATICAIYEALEFSELRRHFLFSEEEQQRIQQARKEQAAVQNFRDNLHSGNATLLRLVQTYRVLRSPKSFLTPGEQRIIEVAQGFLQFSPNDEQTVQLKGNERLTQTVYFYDELFYGPYRFSFTDSEIRQIERQRNSAHLSTPPIMVVNKMAVTITQFLTLYQVTPLYTRWRIAAEQRQLTPKLPERERQQIEQNIGFWRSLVEPGTLAQTVLNDLTLQSLLEQKIKEESERDKSRLLTEKSIQKKIDEFFKELRTFAAHDPQALNIRLSEQDIRYFVLCEVFGRYLQETGSGQTLPIWLSEQQQLASIYYYTRAGMDAPKSTDQQECWLFNWWYIRNTLAQAGQQGGV